GELGITAIGGYDRLQLESRFRKKPSEPEREFFGLEYATHHVSLGQSRRKKVLSRRFVTKRIIRVVHVEIARPSPKQVQKGLVFSSAGIIDHEPHGKSCFTVFASAHRTLQFRQPLA